MKIACFGGSFNPVHIGHVKLVEAIYEAGYEKIIVIPAFHSPFKEAFADTTDQEDRHIQNDTHRVAQS